jgi:hypothetical protein
MRAFRVLVALAVAVAPLALAGCQAGDDVATLRGKSRAELTHLDRTNLMAACLEDAGIRVEVVVFGGDPDQAEISLLADQPFVMHVPGGGTAYGGGEGGSPEQQVAQQEMMDARAAQYDPSLLAGAEPATGESPAAEPPPYLIIGEEDHTEAFAKCVAETGYTAPDFFVSPESELAQKRVAIEGTMPWIACARENGYPQMKDPAAPVADQFVTRPMALLPAETTPDQLLSLLEACPNFDAAAHDAAEEELNRHPFKYSDPDWTKTEFALAEKFPGYLDPEIGFDVPGFDGAAADSADAGLKESDLERLAALQEILDAARLAWWAERTR